MTQQTSAATANWREQLRSNTRRSHYVMATFIFIYMGIGFLFDMLLQTRMTAGYSAYQPMVPLSDLAMNLLTLRVFPIATVAASGVAVISLLITYAIHDRLMLMGTDYTEVSEKNLEDLPARTLYNIVEEMKIAAGMNFMPKIFIIEADYMNAFASGYSERSAMVAITRGLMEKLDRDEIQAVMAHELSHIRHMDIKLTLTASVLSNMILMMIDWMFYDMIYARRRQNDRVDGRLYMLVVVLRFALPVITGLLLLYLSRKREFMADAGSVELMRANEPMARALIKIHNDHQENLGEYRKSYGDTKHEEVRRAAYLYDPVSTGVEPTKSFFNLFSTHPDLAQRLQAIGYRSK